MIGFGAPSIAGDGDAVMTLDPDPGAPSAARAFVAEHGDHLSDDVLHDAQLLVSEVVCNAVMHARSTIEIRVRVFPPGIGVAVTDRGGDIPVDAATRPTQPGTDAVSGRGIAIIDALANAWGVVPSEPPPGKTVWFALQSSRSGR